MAITFVHDSFSYPNVVHCLVWKKYFSIFVAVTGGFGTNCSLVGDCSVHYMVAMYSYNPIELSPNVDADVSVFVLCSLKMM